LISLLARHADCAFWLGRYVERAENLSRIVAVAAQLSHDFDNAGSDAMTHWRQVLDLNGERDRFLAAGHALAPEAAIHYYTLNGGSGGSIRSCLASARFNALQLRPLLPLEAWNHLNGLHQDLEQRSRRPLSEHELAGFCEEIRIGCQAHVGVIEATLYRDEAWYLLQIGRMLERADMTARLIDMRAPWIQPAVPVSTEPAEVSRWLALLRSAAGLHGYRRVHLSRITPDRVAGFLIFDAHHARSVRCGLETAERLLQELIESYQLPWYDSIAPPLVALCGELRVRSISDVIDAGLHEFLDRVQERIIATTAALEAALFPQTSADVSGAGTATAASGDLGSSASMTQSLGPSASQSMSNGTTSTPTQTL